MTTQFQDTDLDVYRGDSNSYTFSILQNDVGFDFSAQSVFAQARSSVDHVHAIFDTRSTTGMSIEDGSGGNDFQLGKVILNITSAISKILPPISRYDLRAYSGSSVTTLASGRLKLKPDVSR